MRTFTIGYLPPAAPARVPVLSASFDLLSAKHFCNYIAVCSNIKGSANPSLRGNKSLKSYSLNWLCDNEVELSSFYLKNSWSYKLEAKWRVFEPDNM